MKMATQQQVSLLLQVISNTKQKRLFDKLDSIDSTNDFWSLRSVLVLKSISVNLRALNKAKRNSFVKLVKNCDVQGLVDLFGGVEIALERQKWLTQLPGVPGSFDTASGQLEHVLDTACRLQLQKYPTRKAK